MRDRPTKKKVRASDEVPHLSGIHKFLKTVEYGIVELWKHGNMESWTYS